MDDEFKAISGTYSTKLITYFEYDDNTITYAEKEDATLKSTYKFCLCKIPTYQYLDLVVPLNRLIQEKAAPEDYIKIAQYIYLKKDNEPVKCLGGVNEINKVPITIMLDIMAQYTAYLFEGVVPIPKE